LCSLLLCETSCLAVQEESTVEVMHAIISPRTLHQLCHVALDTASSGDLQAAPCAALLSTLLSAGAHIACLHSHPGTVHKHVPDFMRASWALQQDRTSRRQGRAGNLAALRNLVLGRCLNVALALPKLTHPLVALAASVAGQATLDNLSHDFPFDAALAAAHLFCACSDAALLRKYARLAVLVAAALREAEQRLPDRASLATDALLALLLHLRKLHAIGPDAAGGGAPSATGACSGDARSVSQVTPAVLRGLGGSGALNGNDGTVSRPTVSPQPSLATQSPRSTTWGSSPCLAQPWKSVAEMQRMSARLCDLEGAEETRDRRASREPLSPLPEEASASLGQPLGRRSTKVQQATGASSGPLHQTPAPPITKCASGASCATLHACPVVACNPSSRLWSAAMLLMDLNICIQQWAEPSEDINCRDDVNKKRYDTVTFLIGEREFYALVRTRRFTTLSEASLW
jgi:hypothetical protein